MFAAMPSLPANPPIKSSQSIAFIEPEYPHVDEQSTVMSGARLMPPPDNNIEPPTSYPMVVLANGGIIFSGDGKSVRYAYPSGSATTIPSLRQHESQKEKHRHQETTVRI